jgi:hypothetical protein
MPRYSLDDVTIGGLSGLKNLFLDNLGLMKALVGRFETCTFWWA